MYEIESKGGAIACLMASLFIMGGFAPVIASLERRGRLPQHTFLDCSITNFLTALFLALTIGQIGDSKPGLPNFLTQLAEVQYNWPSVLYAIGGGALLSVGNLFVLYAYALVGVSIVEVALCCIIVIIGTTINYFLDDRINKAAILFPGVGCFLVAAFLGSQLHKSNLADSKAKLISFENGQDFGKEPRYNDSNDTSANGVQPRDAEKAITTTKGPSFGTGEYLVQLEGERSIKVFGRSMWAGVGMSSLAGLCFAFYSPILNLATNDQFHHLKKGVSHLVIYTAYFYFTASCLVISFVLNMYLMYNPVMGSPKSSFRAYFRDWNGRGWAFLAGLILGLGVSLQFMGGQAAGYAAADAVQGVPLIVTFWGVVIFGEYRKSSRKTYILLASMVLMFIVAVGLLTASAGHREK